MATYNGSINGTNLGVYAGGTLIAFATSATINVNMSLRSTSSKASGGWEENMEGIRNWDVSVDALYVYTNSDGSAVSEITFDELYKTYIGADATGPTDNRASFVLKFGVGTTATGDINYQGSAWVTSLSISAPMEDTSTYSASFQGTGTLTQTIS
tara:strand:+ start:6211 stop:6675 length:465 start_codon:yes stop_codon:yes gene_type:complete